VFSRESVLQLRDATIELFGEVLSVRSVPSCYKQDKFRFNLVVRQPPASKVVNSESEKAMALEAVI
jgi:hypothetical protein